MLERLDTINWSALHHAHGEASDVPILLRTTLSQIKEERDFAFQLLHETIWHQGTVYEASAHVVPFLWEMIQSPETPDKPSVVFLLASLANGHPYLKGHAVYSEETEERFRKFLAKDGLELEAEMAKEERWVAETREAVGQGLPFLYPYLDRGDSHIKWCVAQALACYPEHAQETVPLL